MGKCLSKSSLPDDENSESVKRFNENTGKETNQKKISSSPAAMEKGKRKQIFHSHNWGQANVHHAKVMEFVKVLDTMGWESWVDERDMKGNIKKTLNAGIRDLKVILVYITKEYISKVDHEDPEVQNKTDNCKHDSEFDAFSQEQDKIIILVILEEDLLDTKRWEMGKVILSG